MTEQAAINTVLVFIFKIFLIKKTTHTERRHLGWLAQWASVNILGGEAEQSQGVKINEDPRPTLPL